jgi:hypothetical protein
MLLRHCVGLTGQNCNEYFRWINMTFFRHSVVLAGMLFAGVSSAQTIPVGTKSACMEGPMTQFGQYAGDWDIADSQRSQDGSEWANGAGARWNFVCIGDATAVQDFWIPNDGPVGTNLRTYSEASASWDIAWTIKGLPGAGFAHITAKAQEDGRIVMAYVSPVPDPLRRITFYPADADGWNWTLEMSSDGGENWRAVYKIKASRSH